MKKEYTITETENGFIIHERSTCYGDETKTWIAPDIDRMCDVIRKLEWDGDFSGEEIDPFVSRSAEAIQKPGNIGEMFETLIKEGEENNKSIGFWWEKNINKPQHDPTGIGFDPSFVHIRKGA